jgi:predicted ATPase
VLVSAAVAALLSDQVPTGVTVHDVGEHRLKDFPEPEKLYQLDVAGLPRYQPAPVPRQAAEAHPAQRRSLPAPRSRLIGRADDLATLVELLRANRVVTVTGPGGAGKSTLALAVARELAAGKGRDADVVFAELASASDRDAVLRAVADAAGIQGAGAIDLASLAATLGPRPALLLLDNCEHVLDAAAALVDAVLDAGARVRVLATSREPLGVDGEVVHRLGSLGAESAELFVVRAEAAAGRGVVSVDDPAVVELCRRLDGLPLAIELAAAQLRHLSMAELTERLDDRLTLLVGGRPRGGVRHSTLSATVEWSHQLLSATSRDLFARLGVFPGGFDLAAVESLTPDADRRDVPNLLGDLVAKSMVVHDPERGRYSLLETLRLFAAERLDEAGLRAETLERLRRHTIARATAEPRARTWLSTLTAARSRDDLDNVRLAFFASLDGGDLAGAVDLALGISTLWRNAVSYAEGRRWVGLLLERDLAPGDRLWALVLEADVGLGSGDPRLMNTAAAEAVRLAAAVDDPAGAAVAAIYGSMADLIIDPRRAVEQLEEARDGARAAGEPGLERLARAFRVVALRYCGRPSGLDAEVEALVDARPHGGYDRYLAVWAGYVVALADRDGPRMRTLMDIQLADVRATGQPVNWLITFCDALALIGEGAEYLPELRLARRRAEDEGRRADADCVLALAYAAACHDDWERAAELLGAIEGALFHDTASFIHHAMLRDQVVRPRLARGVFAAAAARGVELDLTAVLDEAGL